MKKPKPKKTGKKSGESTAPPEGVTITASGDVVIGAPTAIAQATPPEEDD